MGGLPVVSGRQLVRALSRVGYVLDRQKGSHMILRQQESPFRRITVPDHSEISKGTLRAIIRHACDVGVRTRLLPIDAPDPSQRSCGDVARRELARTAKRLQSADGMSIILCHRMATRVTE